jgi:hypothetical protein
MRKLSPKELGMLVGTMVVGNLAHASEGKEILPVTRLDTMVVTATYSVPPGATFLADTAPPGAGISGSGPRVPPLVDQQHAQRCAAAYGPYALKEGFSVKYANWYMWKERGTSPAVYQRTDGPSPPPGSWDIVLGSTGWPPPPAIGGVVFVYPPGAINMRNHIETLGHEYAHTQGENNETVAEAAGLTTYQNYKAAVGAACGGYR